MKRLLTFIILMCCICYANAQTQQGIVKTRGRMVNGQLVAGQRLSGATITLNFGNALVSGSQGGFSFNVPNGKSYSLVMAKKQGYTLADPEYTRHSFKYSASNPFYVVLEDETQRQADINAATKKVRRTLIAQLQKREDEIEALKEQNKITEAEYQKKLQELYDNQSKSEQLVKEMAERYASTDYDQLDEFNRQVQMYIEEGELQKADSMIRSKGDMEKRVEEYHNIVEANKKVREDLEKSESGAAKTYEDLSQDLYRRHEIFLQEFKQDSALYCLKMRADLDTTNVEAVVNYANLSLLQHQFSETEKYYLIALRAYNIQNDIEKSAYIQNLLGTLYWGFGKSKQSEFYYRKALDIRYKLFSDNPDCFRSALADTYSGMGTLYSGMRYYTESERYLKLALEHIEILYKNDPDANRFRLSTVQGNMGALYSKLHNSEQSRKYFEQALENSTILFEQSPEKYRSVLASDQFNLAKFYGEASDSANCARYYILSIENMEKIVDNNLIVYLKSLADAQYNLARLYLTHNNFAQAEKLFLQALKNRERNLSLNHESDKLYLYYVQNNLGYLYNILQDYDKSERYYTEALQTMKHKYNESPMQYKEKLAEAFANIAYTNRDFSHYDKAIEAIDSAIVLFPTNSVYYHDKGKILLMQGKNTEALEIWNKVLEMNPNFLNNFPNGTNLSNGLKKLGLIE